MTSQKTCSLLLWLAALLCLPGSAAPVSAPTSAKTKAIFKDPPPEYSTGPLWVWNDLLSEAQIRDTLHDLAAQKVKQVWIHPRPGLMTPYLSDDWFRLWKVALKEAERLDMYVWSYDENSYPSGFAGGLVPDAMPESRGRGLALKETKTPPADSPDLVGVYLLDGDSCSNVTKQLKAGQTLPPGRYLTATEVRAGNSPWHGSRCYVNLLSPGVTEKFLELTMEPHRREIGKYFGNRVPGVFTDEPNIQPAAGLPWSEILPREFQKRWGYDLVEHLPSLNQPVGDWRRIRHNYYQVLHEQFVERWARPNHDYCASNHLEWTGHYWDHDWPVCTRVPDNMAMYAWHQRPAIDCLMNQYAEQTHSQFGNVRMVKELSSIANQLGPRRTLCELYGAGGWDLRFEDMKRIGDWLEVLGVNTPNQHLSYVTIRGARKRDHPQSFSYHEPWWDAYHVSAQYFARVSAALCQGEQINPILVLEPTTSAWMYQGDPAKLAPLGDSFSKLLMALEAAQIEYDLGCEDVLARYGGSTSPAPSGKAELRVGARAYRTLVIPPGTENLNSTTVQRLKEFLESSGAQVLCMGQAPGRVDGQLSGAVKELANRPGWKNVAPEHVCMELLRNSSRLSTTISRKPNDQGILFHHRRQLADGEILFLVNTSAGHPSAGRLKSTRQGIERWDLYTGGSQLYPFARTQGGIETDFELPPSGSLLLLLSNKRTSPPPARVPTVTEIKPQATPVIRRLEPNVLTLDYVDISAGGETRTNIYCYAAGQFAWQKNGMPRNPWDSAVQFKDELISKRFPADSGFEASYRFRIDGPVPADLQAVLERADLYQITCNGQPLKAIPGAWWLDKAFGRIPVAAAARVGENILTVKAAPFTMFHELEPVYILGDFALIPADHGFVITPARPLHTGASTTPAQLTEPAPGKTTENAAWNAQGLPFYPAGVAYRQQFDLGKPAGNYSVALKSWRGSIARVVVNGKLAGYIDAPPWGCDITQRVKRGINDVEITVIGTLKNTLGPHHGNPPLGTAWPGSFHKAPDVGPPPGANYSTVAYGLFEPFVLKRLH